MDSGPPYIVKLANLPVTANDDFVEDLFRCRYTSFVKFKIVFDPSSQPLETGVVKKIAFVELSSFGDQNRVLKWHDLYYRGSRRVVIESADFGDFQFCMSFNLENEHKLREVEREFLSGRSRHGWAEDHGRGMHGAEHQNGGHQLGFGRGVLGNNAPPLSRAEHPGGIPATEPLQPPKQSIDHHPKPNPFGNAKPVDILSKQHDIEKQLITINHTTIKTAGTIDKKTEKKEHSVPKTENIHQEPPSTTTKPGFTPAPIPSSVYGQHQSLADILAQNDSDGALISKQTTRKSATGTPKPPVIKPTILKKKPAITSPLHAPEAEIAVPALSEDVKEPKSEKEESLSEKTARETEVATNGEEAHSNESNGNGNLSKRRELKSKDSNEIDTKSTREHREPRGPKKPRGPRSSREARDISRDEKESPERNGSNDANELSEGARNGKGQKPRREPRGPRGPRGPKEPREPRERRGSRVKSEDSHGREDAPGKEEKVSKKFPGDSGDHEKVPIRSQNLSERNKAFATSARPDFKKHLSEITNASEREHRSTRKPRKSGVKHERFGEKSATSETRPEGQSKSEVESSTGDVQSDNATPLKLETGKPKRGRKPERGTKKGVSKETSEASANDAPLSPANVTPVITTNGDGQPAKVNELNGENGRARKGDGDGGDSNGSRAAGRGKRGGFRGRGRGRGGRGRGGRENFSGETRAEA